jgi:hypothetical protein
MAARVLVDGFLRHADATSALILGENYPKVVRVVRKVRLLLNISEAKSLESTKGSRSADGAALVHLATSLWIRDSIMRYLHDMSQCLWKLARILTEDEEPLLPRLESALFLFDSAVQRPAKALESIERMQRLAKLDWLVKQCDASQRKVEMVTEQVFNVMAKSVPGPMRVQTLYQPDVSVEMRIGLYRQLRTPGTVTNQIGVCFARSQEINMGVRRALGEAFPHFFAEEVHAQSAMRTRPLSELFKESSDYLSNTYSLSETTKDIEVKASSVFDPNQGHDPICDVLEKLRKPRISFSAQVPVSF